MIHQGMSWHVGLNHFRMNVFMDQTCFIMFLMNLM
jgi:hypothetical protein